jgi:hypothetical protein
MKGASQRFTTRDWMAASFCVGLAVFALARLTQIRGADLGATARWSFVLFWLGSTGGALARLFGQPTSELLFFGTAVFWTYLLAGLSLKNLSVRLDPRVWRILRTVGVEYIALAFLVDFARFRFDGGFFNAVYYLPFLALAIAGPALRLAAFVKRTIEKRRTLVGSAT